MTTFILILFIKSGYAGGLTSTEFNSRVACEAALEQAINQLDSVFASVGGVCVRKG